jgi:peptide/nickel transport system substrate-binding protein
LIFALLLLPTGCDVGSTAPATPGGVLTIALASDARDLLPVLYQSTTDANIVDALNVPMFASNFDCALKFKPGLAREWRFSEDGRTVKVDIRRDLTWPDGTRVTADDVTFAWELLGDPKVQSPRADLLARLTPDARPRRVDEHTLEWTFEIPTERAAELALIASVPPLPRHLLDGEGVDRASLRGHPLNAQSPVGYGPWALTEWRRGERLVLEPNPRFSGAPEERAQLGRVVLEVIPTYEDRIAALKAGAVDVVEGVTMADADDLAAHHPDIVLRRRGWRSVEYVAWNQIDPVDWRARSAADADAHPRDAAPHPFFADREVRRALAMAINVDALLDALLTSAATGEVYGRPAVGTVTPGLCGVHNDAIQRLPFAPEDARARLGELGWVDTNNDGWLDKDGVPLRFTLLVNGAVPRRVQAARLVDDQLAAAGVDAVVEVLEPVGFLERLRARDFDAALSNWSASLYVDPSPIWGEDSPFNFTGYRSRPVAELLHAGHAAADSPAAEAAWRDFQAAVYEDQPYAFLYWTDEIVAVDRRFEGAVVDMLGGWRDLHRWRLAEADPPANPVAPAP